MNAIAISNVAIRQTENNLYNLNDLHKASGGEKRHELTNWLKLQQTTELIDELSKPEISGLKENQQVIKVVRGGNKRGTYACKELVYAYATWISAKFFLQVIRTFDAVISGSLTPRKALPNGLTHEQQAEVKALHNILLQSVPFEKQKALAITLWSAVKSKFKVGYKDVPPEQFPEVLSLMARVAVAIPRSRNRESGNRAEAVCQSGQYPLQPEPQRPLRRYGEGRQNLPPSRQLYHVSV